MNEFLNLFSFGYVFRSYSTASTDLEHMMLLPQPPESWNHRHVSPHPASWASQWTKLSNIKLLFGWLPMVHLEPASPVPSQSLAWHSGSRGHISSCDLKIQKELVPTSQSGYQVSFSINLLFIEKMRLLQVLWVMKAERGASPRPQPHLPAPHFQSAQSACTQSSSLLHYVRSTLGMPSTSQELTFEKWLGASHNFFFCTGERNPCLFGHQCNLFFIFPNYESGESSYRSHLTFDLNSPKCMSESYD